MNRTNQLRIATLLLAALIASSAAAVGTKVLTDESEEDFQQGELKSTSLSSDGVLAIAPALEERVETGEPVVWDIAAGENETLFVSTGHEGKVFRHRDGETSPTLLCDLPEVEATSLALTPRGELFIGASPGARIYKVDADDQLTTFTVLNDAYVWDLLYAGQTLYAAAGVEGNIYAIDAEGEAELLFETKASNVLSLARCADDSILASTEQPGLVLQIFPDKSVKVLLDASPYNEVRRVVCGKDGMVYAVLNGSASGGGESARLEALREALGSLAGGDGETAPTAPAQRISRSSGADLQSQIVRINPNGFVQTIWFTPESPIHSLYYDSEMDRLYAGVGEKGLLFEVEQEGKYARALQVAQRSIMGLVPNQTAFYLGTAESGVVYSMARERGLEGVYLSQSLDAGDPVQWGALRVKADAPEGTSITLAMRRGNSSKPDDQLWTDWSEEHAPRQGYVTIEGGPARFLQYRATLRRDDARSPTPSLDTVEAFYLTPNLAPVIKDLTIGAPAQRPSQPERPQNLAALLLQGASEQQEDESPSQESQDISANPNSNPKSVDIRWEVDEPNGDTVEVELFFKGENETTWKKITDEPIRGRGNYRFETATIPDGEYRVKAVISDEPSNPPELSRESEAITNRFYVDNTPPEIEITGMRQLEGSHVLLSARAVDATTTVADAKYNIDAGDWKQIFPEDNIFDMTIEEFEASIEFDAPGEHTVTLMISDREGNTALAKKVVEVEE